ncbi:MAG: hypothetical protein AB7R40_23195 [Nitrospiraceae bacterium]
MARKVWRVKGVGGLQDREYSDPTAAARELYMRGIEWASRYERTYGVGQARRKAENNPNHLYNRMQIVEETVEDPPRYRIHVSHAHGEEMVLRDGYGKGSVIAAPGPVFEFTKFHHAVDAVARFLEVQEGVAGDYSVRIVKIA